MMEAEELLHVLGLGVEVGAPRVHALNEGRDVTEHQRVHHGCRSRERGRQRQIEDAVNCSRLPR